MSPSSYPPLQIAKKHAPVEASSVPGLCPPPLKFLFRRHGSHLIFSTLVSRRKPLEIKRFSAIRHVDCQAALRRLLVFGLHVGARIPHRADHLVERDMMRPIAAERQ